MILVVLGTQDKEFPRLLEAVEKEIKNGNINQIPLKNIIYSNTQPNREDSLKLDINNFTSKYFTNTTHRSRSMNTSSNNIIWSIF